MTIRLEEFEYYVYNQKHEEASGILLKILMLLDKNLGNTSVGLSLSPNNSVTSDNDDIHLRVRLASAISALFSDKTFQFTTNSLNILFTHQRWFAAIFASTPFVNADHIIRSYNVSGMGDWEKLEVNLDNLEKLCVLVFPDSDAPIDLNSIWDTNKELAVSLAMSLLSPRFLGSPKAHSKREILLPWLTEQLPKINSLSDIPNGILHDVYMHCSYADRSDRHEIKKSINQIINNWLESEGIQPVNTYPDKIPENGKPVMLVLVEWFNIGHSIFRTHSRTIEAARNRFKVIGVGYEFATDEVTRKIFDEFIEIKPVGILNEVIQIRDIAEKNRPHVFYMPSVGMFQITMMLTNLRVAPLMIMALGHPATTNSKHMDYVVVEEDYVGDANCFSEELLLLPKDGMPYRASGFFKNKYLTKINTESPDVVNIAVAASSMKINPGFLDACKEIALRSRVKVHFHFLIGFAIGMVYENINRVIKAHLGDQVTVYKHKPYEDYMDVLYSCDMFINPFPFGNTNGIIDSICAHLVGVCKTGREVFEHIDEALFSRFGMPAWLTAENSNDYIKSAIQLAENHTLRNELRNKYSGPDKVELIYVGRPEIMGELIYKKMNDIINSKSK